MKKRLLGIAMLGVLGAGALMTAPAPVQAQGRGCYELWYERNEIYARNGYCFKTARARAVFGPGCFPPYGELRGSEKRRVDELQYWERRNGC